MKHKPCLLNKGRRKYLVISDSKNDSNDTKIQQEAFRNSRISTFISILSFFISTILLLYISINQINMQRDSLRMNTLTIANMQISDLNRVEFYKNFGYEVILVKLNKIEAANILSQHAIYSENKYENSFSCKLFKQIDNFSYVYNVIDREYVDEYFEKYYFDMILELNNLMLVDFNYEAKALMKTKYDREINNYYDYFNTKDAESFRNFLSLVVLIKKTKE